MYTVGIQVSFSAAHFHRGADEKCERIHGHNYQVEVLVSSPTLQEDMVIDFGNLTHLSKEVVKQWDHHLLNELEDFKTTPPTTENIARLLFNKLAARLGEGRAVLAEVQVWEKDDCWASYHQ